MKGQIDSKNRQSRLWIMRSGRRNIGVVAIWYGLDLEETVISLWYEKATQGRFEYLETPGTAIRNKDYSYIRDFLAKKSREKLRQDPVQVGKKTAKVLFRDHDFSTIGHEMEI